MKRKLLALLAIPAAVVVGRKLLDELAGQPVLDAAHTGRPQALASQLPLGGELSEELLDILVCPEDKGELELIEGGHYLLNPRNGYRYPIRDGSPIMLIDEGRANRIPV